MSRVLLVDDEKNVLTTLAIGLRRFDYTVKQAQSGPEALEIMEKEPCEIVVSDVRMSPMDGYTLASEISHKFPKVGIILMSAYSFEDELPQTESRFVCQRLTKPFTISELVDLVKVEEKKVKYGMPCDLSEFHIADILFIGDSEYGKKLSDQIRPEGFDITVMDPREDPALYINSKEYDLFLVTEKYLENVGWRILNDIDRLAPNKHVILLVEKRGDKDYFGTPDLALSVLNKNIFFQDLSRAVAILKKNFL